MTGHEYALSCKHLNYFMFNVLVEIKYVQTQLRHASPNVWNLNSLQISLEASKAKIQRSKLSFHRIVETMARSLSERIRLRFLFSAFF